MTQVDKKWRQREGERARTGDVAAPYGAIVALVRAEALAVVGEPDGRGEVLGAGEEEVAVPVVLEEGQGPLMPLHQYRPHLLLFFFFFGQARTGSAMAKLGLGLAGFSPGNRRKKGMVNLRKRASLLYF